jgi:type IV pilus assembly protein PilQ
VTVAFKEADLRDALRLLAKQSGMNIVVSGEVEGTVTAQLVDMPFQEALQVILGATGYGYTRKGRTYVVGSPRVVTRVVRTRYVDARRVARSVAEMLSPDGAVQALVEGEAVGMAGEGFCDQLLLREREDRVEEILAAIAELDRRPKQVHIDAKIVETSLGDDEKLGIRWNVSLSGRGATAPTTFPFPKTTGDDSRFMPTPDPGDPRLYIKAPFPEGELFPYGNVEDFQFGKLSASEFEVLLQAIASRRNVNLVSSPSITTLDNRAAEILVGQEIPVARYERHKETGVMEVIGYDQQKVGVTLWVTPHVCGDSTLILEIVPETSSILDFVGVYNERPITSTRVARTQVLLRSGETVVIGGLIREVEREVRSKVPILGDLPLLKYLFSHRSKEKRKVDLLVFITPRIEE